MKDLLKELVALLLSFAARQALKRNPQSTVIVVGGNVGKTSTKDAIFALLSDSGKKVRRSLKSFNSELGLPLSILALPNAWNSPFLWMVNIAKAYKRAFFDVLPDILVLELGADKKGDIEKAAKWLRADILVLTEIPEMPVHVENFRNKEELFNEKKNLLKLLKDDSVLIYDKDSKISSEFASEFKGCKLSFALLSDADFKIKDKNAECESGLSSGYSATLSVKGKDIKVKLQESVGWQRLKSALVALATAEHMSLDVQDLSKKLDSFASNGRMRLLEAKKEAMIIDDTYNSSPKAALAALDVLSEFDCIKGKKIVALADMLELGKYTVDAHKEVLQKAIELASRVYLLGPVFSKLADEFQSEKIKVFSKTEQDKLAEDLLHSLNPGDLVLLKGSQSMRMEKVTKALLKDESRAKDLLVRQEKEWIKR